MPLVLEHAYTDLISVTDYIQQMREHPHLTETDEAIARLVKSLTLLTHPASRVVELGAGPVQGRLTPLLATLHTAVIAVEIDPVFCKHARDFIIREASQIILHEGDVLNYISPDPIAIAVSMGMHHHIPKPSVPIYLRNIYNQLAEDGVYILADEFLLPYQTEDERKINAILWYSYVVSIAKKHNCEDLVMSEINTLLDDLHQGMPGQIKTQEQIEYFYGQADLISYYLETEDFFRARKFAHTVYEKLNLLAQNSLQVSNSTRGDFKICHRVLAEEVTQAGFKIDQVITIGPVHTIGGFHVYVLKKA